MALLRQVHAILFALMALILCSCGESGNKKAECLIENLLFCEIIHWMGSLAGNSSFNVIAMLSYNMFIHPRLLELEENLHP